MLLRKIKYKTPTEEIEDEIPYLQSGKWPNERDIDRILVELILKRTKIKYLPTNLEISGEKLHVTLDSPHKLSSSSSLYIGGIEARQLDRWGYCTSLLFQVRKVFVEVQDGLKFEVHSQSNLSGKDAIEDIRMRVTRAIMSIYPEWKEFKVLVKLSGKVAFSKVSSGEMSHMDIASKDFISRDAIYEVIGAKDAERFFLERSNVHLQLGNDPYPFQHYDEKIDGQLLDGLGETGGEKELIKGILDRKCMKNKNHTIVETDRMWSYGNIKVQKTKKLESMMKIEGINVKDLLSMMGRYLSINGKSDSQFTHTPKVVADMLHSNYDVRYEGYSGPFNAMHKTFSSMYLDLDEPFGSVGPFNSRNIINHQDHNMSINPPFTSYFYKHTKDSIEEAFKSNELMNKNLLIFCKQPNWYDEESIEWFKSDDNPYLVGHYIFDVGEFFFERLNGNTLNKLTGGLLLSILSPVGKSHPQHSTILKDIVDFYKRSTPKNIRDQEKSDKIYVDKWTFAKMIKESTSTSAIDIINEILKGEKYTTELTREEMSDYISNNV